MSRMMQTGSSPVLGANRHQQPVLPALRRIVVAMGHWTLRRRTRTQLNRLSPYMLEDIGITPAQARKEAERPFWKG